MNESLSIKFSKPLNILVVEDSNVDLRVLQAMLTESEGYSKEIKTATTLKGALESLEVEHYDAVILDLNLPDSEGVGTIMKVNKLHPHLPIVVSTGAYEEELGLKALSCGAQDFLVKGRYTAYILIKVLHYAIERKRLERELAHAYSDLQKTQSQLVQAEKMKIGGALASGVAHEVRNPLATIVYGVTYLKENLNLDDDKVKLVIDNINEASHRANEIIKDLLDFASLTRLNRVPEDLNLIVEKSLNIASHRIEKNKIKLVQELASGLKPINIDSNRVSQVIINLILNAINAMPSGGEIKLSTLARKADEKTNQEFNLNEADYEAGEELTIFKVEDEGKGVPENKLKEIFDPFFTTNRATGGVGLGLSVCQNIMDIHDGQIRITNRPSGGVCAALIFKKS